jgi:predicted Rossmann fold flavoprotein
LDFKNLHHLKNIENALPYDLPKRLWNFFFEQIELDAKTKWAEVPNKKINALVEFLCNSQYKALGKTTNKEEFVTSGGVSLKDVDMKTMQSKKVNNLYFAGEVLNIDGITGGFNFQAAWSTAYVSAKLNA